MACYKITEEKVIMVDGQPKVMRVERTGMKKPANGPVYVNPMRKEGYHKH